MYIMFCLTVNVCYVVVINFQVWLYTVRSQIEINHTRVQQYVLMSTETHHVVHCMKDVHKRTAKHVQIFLQFPDLILLKKLTHERSLR